MLVDASTEARELIRIIRKDSGLPLPIRRAAGRLAALASTNPDLALERLGALRASALPLLPMEQPTIDYSRCISVEVFWRYNLAPTLRDYFVTPEDYRRVVEQSPNPSARLSADLGQGYVVPAQNSWLVPNDSIDGLTGMDMKVRLNFDQPPPYVVFVLSVPRMKASGVAVRAPRGVDTVPSRLIQWFPENVPGERIDRDIPVAAVERIEWRM